MEYVVSCREVGPRTAVSGFTCARQDAEAMPTTSLGNRVASFNVLAATIVRHIYRLAFAQFPTELKRKRRVGLTRAATGAELGDSGS